MRAAVPGEYVRTKADHLAIEQGAYWDEAEADKVTRFAEAYFRSQFIQGEFKLLPWQRDWLRQLYGWRRDDGRRRWRKVLLTLAKKGGKTLLVAIVALYEMLAAGVPSPLVVSASTTAQNAKQVFEEVRNSVNLHPKLKPKAKIRDSYNLVHFPGSQAKYKAISNDSGNAEGLNLSCCICDEVHAWESTAGRRLYEALEYSTVARPNGVLITISTAGSDQGHFYYDLVTKARNVVKGDDLDTSLFATLYEADVNDPIDDPATWRKANPSLGVSFTEEDFRRDLETAKRDTAALLSFRRYRLNQWCQADNAFIDPVSWDRCQGSVDERTLEAAPLFLGCDLSQTTDMCSVSMVWALPNRRYHVRNHSWVCEEGVRKRESTNLPRYQQYASTGELTITKGTVNDYRSMRRYILDLRERHKLRVVVFDYNNAMEMCAELEAEGILCERQYQNHRAYTGPMKEFEVAIKEGRVTHEGSSLLRWALSNTIVDVNAVGDIRPDRGKSTDKIDPAVSTLMAFGRAVSAGASMQEVESVYNSRPVFRF